HAGEGGLAQLEPWLAPLKGLNVTELAEGEASGADISTMGPAAVPMFKVDQDGSRYFETHHSAADTLDKVEPEALAKTAAAVAVVAYALAEMPQPLPRPPPTLERHRPEPPKPPAH